jgi:hypothetical protein
MGSKHKTPSMPATPTYQNNPMYQQSSQGLYDYSNKLLSGDYSGTGLENATSYDPQMTKLALESAQGFLQPQYQQNNQDAMNQAAANNQLESSTFTNALAKNAFNLNSQYQSIGAGAALQDRQTANTNRVNLFGKGLDTLGGVAQMGLTNQGQENSFNLENYQNQVAKALAEQKSQSGGLMGGLTGAIGGGMSGFAMGGPIGAIVGAGIGGYSGAVGTPGTGGQFLQSGAGIYGNSIGGMGGSGYGGQQIYPQFALPGQYATNGIGR